MKPFVAVLVLALALSGCAANVDSFSFSGSRSDAPMRAIGYATVMMVCFPTPENTVIKNLILNGGKLYRHRQVYS